jgi:ABC-type amino acid transport substrate-binding protein
MHTRILKSALAVLAMLALPMAANAEPPKTITPGKLTVGFNGDMPMTGLKDGKLIGTDGELLAKIAERLGLEIEPRQMEWSGAIQATKQGLHHDRSDLLLRHDLAAEEGE